MSQTASTSTLPFITADPSLSTISERQKECRQLRICCILDPTRAGRSSDDHDGDVCWAEADFEDAEFEELMACKPLKNYVYRCKKFKNRAVIHDWVSRTVSLLGQSDASQSKIPGVRGICHFSKSRILRHLPPLELALSTPRQGWSGNYSAAASRRRVRLHFGGNRPLDPVRPLTQVRPCPSPNHSELHVPPQSPTANSKGSHFWNWRISFQCSPAHKVATGTGRKSRSTKSWMKSQKRWGPADPGPRVFPISRSPPRTWS